MASQYGQTFEVLYSRTIVIPFAAILMDVKRPWMSTVAQRLLQGIYSTTLFNNYSLDAWCILCTSTNAVIQLSTSEMVCLLLILYIDYISLSNKYVIFKSLGLLGITIPSSGMFREMHKLDQDLSDKKICRRVLVHTSELLKLLLNKREETTIKYTDPDVTFESLIQKRLLMGLEHDLVIVVELVMVPVQSRFHPHNMENHDCRAVPPKLH